MEPEGSLLCPMTDGTSVLTFKSSIYKNVTVCSVSDEYTACIFWMKE
jgi:hypothetical protein